MRGTESAQSKCCQWISSCCGLLGARQIYPPSVAHVARMTDITSSEHDFVSLLSVVPLYVGMPVILHVRNLSTDLGITNGSQGIM